MAPIKFKRLPLTVNCEMHGIPSQTELSSILRTHGHIRLRGLPLSFAHELESKYGHLVGTLMGYKGGTKYRDTIDSTRNVLEAGHIPPHLDLGQHNEMSYSDRWPDLLALCCIENTLPLDQGITPICDNKKVLDHLPAALLDKYLELGVKYTRSQIDDTRHIPEGTRKQHTSWQRTFMTDNKEDVERECERNGYQFRWNDDGSLFYEYNRPAFVRHPRTGDITLFNTLNGVDWYGNSDLEATRRPFWNQWGDGQEFSEKEKSVMKGLYEEFTVGDPWKKGDLLLLDNHYTTHGRTPFNPSDGQRVIGVMMGNQVVRSSSNANGVGLCEFAE